MKTFIAIACFIIFSGFAAAQESPYFVTYDQHLEEPGNLKVELSSTVGIPREDRPAFIAPYSELEYGIAGWWTSELYMEGLSRRRDSTIFTGWRLENRLRVFSAEHQINPVLYFEYEDLNEASRIQKEIVGHAPTFDEPNSELRRTRARELEGKIILGSTVHDWNLSENFTIEKNLSADEGLEFGYALGVSRPLSSFASAKACRFCRENFVLGAELYGGLGSTQALGFADTAHYLAPTVGWRFSDNASLRVSPGIGLTHASEPILLRFGFSYEIRNFGPAVAQFLRRGH